MVGANQSGIGFVVAVTGVTIVVKPNAGKMKPNGGGLTVTPGRLVNSVGGG
jgi:hypothetical protein